MTKGAYIVSSGSYRVHKLAENDYRIYGYADGGRQVGKPYKTLDEAFFAADLKAKLDKLDWE